MIVDQQPNPFLGLFRMKKDLRCRIYYNNSVILVILTLNITSIVYPFYDEDDDGECYDVTECFT